MAEALSRVGEWVRRNKLKTVGTLWAGTIAGSLAYNFSTPGPRQTKVIHARLHAQFATLIGLGIAASVDHFSRTSGSDDV
jgi:hypothetical protein